MASPRMVVLALALAAFSLALAPSLIAGKTVFREYIGSQFNGVKLKDVPVNNKVDEIHFILAFAIDYRQGNAHKPTNGKFGVFWQSETITPAAVKAVKATHPRGKVKVIVSLGGDSVGEEGKEVQFAPSSVASWVNNAVESLTAIIRRYDLDGIDIDYEHFRTDSGTFASCVGQLIRRLKSSGVISVASIAPLDDGGVVQAHYAALWRWHSGVIDYVNFQFYAQESLTTQAKFVTFYNRLAARYGARKLAASFSTEDKAEGLTPARGFFSAANNLRSQGKLSNIFVWCADTSKDHGGFHHEIRAQALLAS